MERHYNYIFLHHSADAIKQLVEVILYQVWRIPPDSLPANEPNSLVGKLVHSSRAGIQTTSTSSGCPPCCASMFDHYIDTISVRNVDTEYVRHFDDNFVHCTWYWHSISFVMSNLEGALLSLWGPINPKLRLFSSCKMTVEVRLSGTELQKLYLIKKMHWMKYKT